MSYAAVTYRAYAVRYFSVPYRRNQLKLICVIFILTVTNLDLVIINSQTTSSAIWIGSPINIVKSALPYIMGHNKCCLIPVHILQVTVNFSENVHTPYGHPAIRHTSVRPPNCCRSCCHLSVSLRWCT